ncbi:endo-1,4-beta-xylanase [Maribacter sp. TH_r10]|uniref:endo-1,4-beta-xylanase n=1 Tax=Maribacter sp. TH_r10 TaxID=3082086 RepID=UPI0029533334|nr:endo-1,4-beta-xylanase [Maribacter sp. TH_r10]MDV7140562.1 endo-1,4-beta-xylanase [Maribacter sp. TH_r10]
MTMTYKIRLLLIVFVFSISACQTKNKETKKENSKSEISLKDHFKGSFLIGAAINDGHIDRSDSLGIQLLEKEFNSITAENIMKWMYVHPEKDSYFFDTTDKFVALGQENGMYIVGHNLVWHSQLAEWVNPIKDSLEMATLLKNHINTIVSRYKGKIDAWDVVNEALNEDGTLRESVFSNTMGDSFLEVAFKEAAKTDPDAELIYNDYNLWKPEKRDGVVRLVKKLQEKGAKIDGVGIQAHWSLEGPSIEDIENSIIAFSELGVKVSFTELDVTVLPNPWDLDGAAVNQNYNEFEGDPTMNPYPNGLPDSVKLQLSNRYQDIFNLFTKHKDKINRVTFWGVQDGQSWLNNWPINGRTNYPLFFDRNYQPKKVYTDIISAKNN